MAIEEVPGLRRTKSLKTFPSLRKRRDSAYDELNCLPMVRPIKHTLIQLRIDSEEARIRTAAVPRTLEPRLRSSRETWPPLREKMPGSYAFDEAPTLTKTPWEYNRARRPPSQWSRSTGRSSLSEDKFAQLPREIMHCILDQLRGSHFDGARLHFMDLRTDLRNLCTVDKHWHRAAREHLYREIWLPQHGEPQRSRLLPWKKKTRLQLLQSTLEEAPGLARLVRRLRIPFSLSAELDVETFLLPTARKDGALSVISEIVRACPNLRALFGHYPIAFDRTTELYDALASREELREHVWHFSQHFSRPRSFGRCYEQWRSLETLVLWDDVSQPGYLEPGSVSAVVQRLPSLKHLMIKGLSRSDVHNGTLLMLPALKSLRLEDVAGVTDHGIEQLAHSRLAMSLENLSLTGLELTSLRTIQAIFASFHRLKRFALVQRTTPELQGVLSVSRGRFSLASSTLESLHWHAMVPGNALAILANEMAAGKFPKLRKVKVPYDYDGAIQGLSRPVLQRPFTADELGELAQARSHGSDHRMSTKSMQFEALIRAKRSRREPSAFSVVIHDEDQRLCQTHVLGSYLGNLASKIKYSLEPDVQGSSYAQAQIDELSRQQVFNGGRAENVVGLETLF